jgi:uncharacterized protein (TIGR01732 family)
MDKFPTYDDKVKNKTYKEVFLMDGAFGGGFALIVVLFILLIIVGASWVY